MSVTLDILHVILCLCSFTLMRYLIINIIQVNNLSLRAVWFQTNNKTLICE